MSVVNLDTVYRMRPRIRWPIGATCVRPRHITATRAGENFCFAGANAWVANVGRVADALVRSVVGFYGQGAPGTDTRPAYPTGVGCAAARRGSWFAGCSPG